MMIVLPRFSNMNDSADAVYANVSVPCNTTNPSYSSYACYNTLHSQYNNNDNNILIQSNFIVIIHFSHELLFFRLLCRSGIVV